MDAKCYLITLRFIRSYVCVEEYVKAQGHEDAVKILVSMANSPKYTEGQRRVDIKRCELKYISSWSDFKKNLDRSFQGD